MTCATSEAKNKRPEDCVFWRCRGMDSPFTRDQRRETGEIGRCGPRKMECELETGREGCGMFLRKQPSQTDSRTALP